MKMEKLKYPNPQFIRNTWFDLNGEWEFCFDDEDIGIAESKFCDKDFFDMTIKVPYSYNTKNSGLNIKEDHSIVWYRKEFNCSIKSDKRYILHFGAIDYESDLWINGKHVSKHVGGHVQFQVDISDYIMEDNVIVVRVKDENHTRTPIGKQSWKDHNFLCWYTRTIGIWQPVYLEETGKVYLTSLRMTPDIDQASLSIDAILSDVIDNTHLNVEISYAGKKINEASVLVKNGRVQFTIDVSSNDPNFRLNFWHVDDPHLYDITLNTVVDGDVQDRVESYFGMRSVEVSNGKVYLNNQEFYQKLILDQGYIKDGGMTLTVNELKDNVEKIKEMGFNGVRKHQKIETHHFMYLCDRLGLVMWAEMPSPFEYSFETNQRMVSELYPFIEKHYNHPSVIAYVLMNESWGINEVYSNTEQQKFVNGLYHLTHSLDETRLVIGNDGWEHTLTDLVTVHDYNGDPETLKKSYEDFKKFVNGSPSRTSTRHVFSKGYEYDDEPFLVSEYGGVAYESIKEGNESWGYGDRLNSKDEVLQRISSLTKVIMDNDNIQGFCYTQLSDVQQEVNGLLDENHNYKFDPKEIRKIMKYKHNLGFKFI